MTLLGPFFKKEESSYSRRPSAYLDRPLQLRFIRRIITVIMGASLLAFVPALYFINENLNFIRNMLVDVAPDMIRYVEREQVFVNISIVSLFLAQVVFLSIYVRKMSAQIVAPIKKLTLHFRDLSMGKLHADEIHIREEDEFQDLINTYNYFYYCIRKQRSQEIKNYEEALKQELPPSAREIIKDLLEQKRAQFNNDQFDGSEIIPLFKQASDDSSSKREKPDGSRHVS